MAPAHRLIRPALLAVLVALAVPCAAAAQEFDDERPADEAPMPGEQPPEGADAPPDHPAAPDDEAVHDDATTGDIPVERAHTPPAAEPDAPAQPPDSAKPPEAVAAPEPAPAPSAKPAGKNAIKKKKGEPQDAVIKVSLKVIYASKEAKSVDGRIKDLAKGFQKEFKEYELTKFVLLESKEFKIEPRVTLPIDLPGGRRLNLTNGGIKDKKVVLQLDVPDLIKTTVLVAPAGKFSFGGPKYKYGDGMVILVLKARPAGK